MRFVSHIRKFAVGIVEYRAHATPYGDTIVDREGYTAEFNQDDLTDADLEFAEKEFAGMLNGRTTTVDEVTLTPLLDRISVFDTDEEALRHGWDDDFKKLVEEKLSSRSVDHPDFRQVMVEPIEAPWPRYLDFRGSLEDLMQKLVDDGHDLHRVIAYERQSGHRPQVEAALERLIAAVDAETEGAEQVPA